MAYSGRVLIVEDDTWLRRARAARLQQHGLDVIAAADGDEGVRMARTPPLADVIVVDLATPQRDLDVRRAVHANPATATIPVLLLSHSSRPRAARSDRTEAPADGANPLAEHVARLVQPVDIDRLHEFLDGTGETFQSIAQLFVADYDDRVPELEQACERRAAVHIEKLAHRVRGTASACAANRLADLLLEMERLAREGQADAAAAIMPSVQRELRAVKAFLSTSAAVDG